MSDISEAKEVAYYSESLSAWYTTKLEKDKHLLSLSSAAIALLVTLATTVAIHDIKAGVAYCIALVAFLTCIVCVLVVLDKNAEYLKSIVTQSRKVKNQSTKLECLDKISSGAFVIGVVFTLLVGLFSALDSYEVKGNVMTDKNKNTEQTTSNKIENTSNLKINSLAGAHEMAPSAALDESTSTDSTQSESAKLEEEGE